MERSRLEERGEVESRWRNRRGLGRGATDGLEGEVKKGRGG